MDIIGLTIIPVFFLFNSYLLGKLFQKTGKSITNFFSFSIGFLFLVFLLSIISIPFYILPDISEIYPYTLLGLQIGLIAIYIFNIKQLIFSFLFNWNKFLLLTITLSIAIVFWFICLYLKNKDILITSSNDSIFDYFHFSIFKIFSFDNNDISNYFLFTLPITLSFPLSTALCHSYQFVGKPKLINFVFYIFIVCFFSIFTFLNIEYVSSFFSFLIIPLPIVFHFFFNKTLKKHTNNYFFHFGIYIFYLVFLNWNFLFLSCFFVILFSLSSITKKQDLESGKIWQVFIYLIGVFAIFFLKIDILISLIILFIFATCNIFYLLYKKNKKYYLHQFIIEKYLFNKVQRFLFISLIIFIVIVTILLSQSNYVFNHYFFLVHPTIISYVNISTWIQYSLLLYFSFIYFFYSLFAIKKYDSSLTFISNIFVLFFNPLSLSFLTQISDISNGNLVVEDYWLWGIFFSLLLFFFYNKIIKFQYYYLFSKKEIKNYNYKNLDIYEQVFYMALFSIVFFITSSNAFIVGNF